jgi:hypothetical protein
MHSLQHHWRTAADRAGERGFACPAANWLSSFWLNCEIAHVFVGFFYTLAVPCMLATALQKPRVFSQIDKKQFYFSRLLAGCRLVPGAPVWLVCILLKSTCGAPRV